MSNDPCRRVRNAIALRFLDQSEHGDRVVLRGLEAFADEGSAGIRPFAGHIGQFCKAFVE
jgi:hypothetical protein